MEHVFYQLVQSLVSFIVGHMVELVIMITKKERKVFGFLKRIFIKVTIASTRIEYIITRENFASETNVELSLVPTFK